MRCPYCRDGDSRVLDSRDGEDGSVIRRRRSCQSCGRRFTTLESVSLQVVKRSGALEPFSREKVVAGVRKACQGRPVDEDALALLAYQVEEAVRSTGGGEIPAHEVGLAILTPLRALDEVAYLRFASVYQGFESLGDFERCIADLRARAPRVAQADEPAAFACGVIETVPSVAEAAEGLDFEAATAALAELESAGAPGG